MAKQGGRYVIVDGKKMKEAEYNDYLAKQDKSKTKKEVTKDE